MNRFPSIFLAVAVLCTVVKAVPAATHTVDASPLRVLSIGNSFSQSLCRYFPAAAAETGASIEFCNLFIGGCSLSRHADNIRKGAENPVFAPYDVTWFDAGKPDSPRKFKCNVPQMLATQKWDVVTIQQASHESWNPDTYRPAADEVIAEIRRLAPQAEIVIQQTWAYNAADGRIGGDNPKWGFDQAGMAERVERAYAKLADDFGLRVIPVGAAVRLRREALAAEERVFDPASLKALASGQRPDVCGDPVGNYWWKTDSESGEKKLQRDHIHLNRAGEYLQAMVWLGFLTGRDPRSIAYAPKDVFWADDIPGLRAAAALALEKAGTRPDGRRLVWQDEFGGNVLDPAKWQVWGTMSSTDNIYTNDERTVQVAEGLLRLRVLPSGVTGKVATLPRGLVTRDTSSSTTKSSPPATAGARRKSAFVRRTIRSRSNTKSTGCASGRERARSCFPASSTARASRCVGSGRAGCRRPSGTTGEGQLCDSSITGIHPLANGPEVVVSAQVERVEFDSETRDLVRLEDGEPCPRRTPG